LEGSEVEGGVGDRGRINFWKMTFPQVLVFYGDCEASWLLEVMF